MSGGAGLGLRVCDGSGIIGRNRAVGVPSRCSVKTCGMNKCLAEWVPEASWGQRHKESV